MVLAEARYLVDIEDDALLKSELKQYIQALGPDELRLQQALSQSSMVSDSGINVLIFNVARGKGTITVRAGIQYKGFVAGCSCADDPSPVPEIDEYCELSVCINSATGTTDVELLA